MESQGATGQVTNCWLFYKASDYFDSKRSFALKVRSFLNFQGSTRNNQALGMITIIPFAK
jgi:hypothetical protein